MKLPRLSRQTFGFLFRRGPAQTKDRVALSLPGLALEVERVGRPIVPAELTVVIPRAELRAKLQTSSGEQASVEVVLNSITVAHSPRLPGEPRPKPPAVQTTPLPTPGVSRESTQAGT